MFKGGLTRIQFYIQNVYAYVKSLSTKSINPTRINHPDLRQLLDDAKDKFRSHPMIQLTIIP